MASLQALAQEAHDFSSAGQHVEAASKYDEILAMNDEIAEVHLNKGVSLSNAGNKDGALSAFKRAVELKPELIAAYTNMGNIYKNKGNHQDAIEAFRKATKMDPSMTSNWGKLAHEYSEVGDFNMALSAATDGIEANKSGNPHVTTHNERIFAHFKMENPHLAVDDVEAIISVTPMNELEDGQKQLYCMVLAQGGSKFMEDGDLSKAEYFLEMACENDPSAENLLVYGVCLIQLEKDEEALQVLENAKHLDPSMWKVLVAMGTIHIKNQNFDEAATLFQAAMEFPAPKKDSNVNFNYAIVLMNLGRDLEAKGPLELVVKAEPDNWVALSLLGTIYLLEEEFAKAAAVFEKASKIPGADADSSLFYNLGYSKLMQNKPDDALKAFERAIEINPESDQAIAAYNALKSKQMSEKDISEAIEIANDASGTAHPKSKGVSFSEDMQQAAKKARNPVEMAQTVLVPQRPQFGLDPHLQGSRGFVSQVTTLFEELNANTNAELEVMRKPSIRQSLKNVLRR